MADILPAALLSARPSITSTRPAASRSAGPTATPGLTGRKIIVDTYGGAAPHGGGAFSRQGSDQSRSLGRLYGALPRQDIVAAGFAERCTIQLAYAIGVSEPLSLYVDTHRTGTVGDDALEKAIHGDRQARQADPARHPHASAAQQADLLHDRGLWPLRAQAEGDLFPWEKTDLGEDLKAALA